jgi:hypothetical protein
MCTCSTGLRISSKCALPKYCRKSSCITPPLAQCHRKRSHTTYHHSLNGTGRDRTHVSPLTHCDTKRSSTACLHSLTVVTCNPHVTQRQDNRNSTHACNQCITITIYITPLLDSTTGRDRTQRTITHSMAQEEIGHMCHHSLTATRRDPVQRVSTHSLW